MKGVVTVAQGRIRGIRRDGLWSFAGIPYARAPVGLLRWRPPLPPEGWIGVRDASSFGPVAPQSESVFGLTSPGDPSACALQSEDCLSLNVWTPELPGEAPVTDPTERGRKRGTGRGRPVMVFIHGGGFTSGSGSVFLYGGGALARNGRTVLVTINYRLGALGFLGHRALGDPEGFVGNWGIHDQIAALRWVRDNIEVFGGDAANVTVFGESAGGFSVATLLGTPAAAGLFRRAVVQSGGVHVHNVGQAEQAARRLTSVLGLASCDRSSLERVPAPELVAAADEMGRRRPDPGGLPLPFLPVVDGVLLPEHPLAAVARGAADGVDLLIGTNRDELTLFGITNPTLAALDEEAMAEWVANAVPDMPSDEVIGTYRSVRRSRSEPVGATDIWVAVGSDLVFRWPSLQLAAAHGARGSRAYVYLFEWESPALGGLLGACHALELPFVFGAVDLPAVQMFTGAGPDVEALSAQMQQSWITFAASGSPGHDDIGAWHQWEPTTRATMIFGSRTGLVEAPRDEELAILEKHRPLEVGRGAEEERPPGGVHFGQDWDGGA